MRSIDRLPMTIRFVSDFLRDKNDMSDMEIVERAYNLATMVAAKFKNESYNPEKISTKTTRVIRGMTSRDHVENLWIKSREPAGLR